MDDAVRAIIGLSILFVAGVVGLLPAGIAAGKGRGFLTWWLFGTLLLVVALPLALSLKPRESGP
ncbi:MAG: hypothetical protein JO127_07175 [Caulobacteraceae bacterium]|nr:hypothetical protein [Caulobacteraceae bacterium]